MVVDPSEDLVFVVCAGRSGSTLLRFLLDAHPDLACPPETRLPAICAQLATVWQQLAGAAADGNGDTPPGLRTMAARLLSGMARLDERFATLWSPCSGEVFLFTVTTPGGGAVAARWRVDLAAPAITSASGLAPGETGGAQWDIIGSADTWKQVLDGGIDLGVAFRTRQLRYCDTGDVAAAVPGIRVAMLSELLALRCGSPRRRTAWRRFRWTAWHRSVARRAGRRCPVSPAG
jgi:hypothetical protein